MPMNAAWLYAFEYGTGRWRPEIGDPSVMGWATVAAYGACALLAFWAARVRPADDRRCFWFWVTVGLLMVVLAVNKQLDLQTLFTDIGRQVARHQGWIEQRRTVGKIGNHDIRASFDQPRVLLHVPTISPDFIGCDAD